MQSATKLAGETRRRLRCPACAAPLAFHDEHMRCRDEECGRSFPIVRGVPVLINEARSVFSIREVTSGSGEARSPKPGLATLVRRLVPGIGRNVKARENFKRLAELLLDENVSPRVLVVGGGQIGFGMDGILSLPSIEFVETDIAFDDRTSLILDAHDIPFEDGTFDGVIIQGVLSLVVDPHRCVEEIHRVLKPRGFVYAETAFIQQVAGGPYDFTRFTHLGHRRLFRHFEEVSSGPVGGSGMALAWSYHYFLLNFATSRTARRFLGVFARFTGFWLRFFDGVLVERPGAFDAAPAYFLLARRSDEKLSDAELMRQYRGLIHYAV